MESKHGHGLSMHDDESMERAYRSGIDGDFPGTGQAEVEREKRMRRVRTGVLSGLAVAVIVGGVLVAGYLSSQGQAQPQAGSPSQPQAATTTPVTNRPTPTPSAAAETASPSASAMPAADPTWTRFVSPTAQVQFDLPLGWTATDVPAGTVGYPGSGIKVADEQGKVMAKFYYAAVGGVGGACGPGTYKQTELDRADTSLTGQWVTDSHVRFSYHVLDQTAQGGGISYQIGLVDKFSGELRDSCLMYTFLGSAPKGTLSFATTDSQGINSPTFSTMDEAVQYMQTPEYQKLKRMITSLQLAQ